MGRFYKTAKPQMIDFMYKIPENLILASIKAKDEELAAVEKDIFTLKNLKSQALKLAGEEGKKNEIIKLIESKADELTKRFQKDPTTVSASELSNIKNDVFKELTRGSLFAYDQNKKIRDAEYSEKIKKAEDLKSNINPANVSQLFSITDDIYDYSGGANYNSETGEFKSYNPPTIVADPKVAAKAIELSKELTSHKTDTYKAGSTGSYLYKWKEEKDILGLSEATNTIYNEMSIDPSVTSYYNNTISQLKRLEQVLANNGLTPPEIEQTMKQRHGYTTKSYEDFVYGERDENNQFVLEEAKDEKGEVIKEKYKDAEGNVQERTMKKMKNPGLLYRTAQAAADFKDKYDIKSGYTDWTPDDFEKQRRSQEHDKTMKDLEKVEILTGTNLLVKPEIVEGTTIDEKGTMTVSWNNSTKAVKEGKIKNEESITTYFQQLSNNINSSNATALEKAKMINGLDAAFQKAKTGNTSDLKALLNPIMGFQYNGQTVGSGIDEAFNSYSRQKIKFDNEANMQNVIFDNEIEKEINKLRKGNKDFAQSFGNRFQLSVDYTANKDGSITFNSSEAARRARKEYAKILDAAGFNKNLSTALANVNNSKMSVTATQGETLDNLSPEESIVLKKALNNATQTKNFMNNLITLLNSNAGASIVVTEKNKSGSKQTNFEDLVKRGIFNYDKLEEGGEYDEQTGEITAKTTTASGDPITLNVSPLRIVPQNVSGVGKYSRHLTIQANDGKRGITTYDIVVPKNAYTISQVDDIMKKNEPAASFKDFVSQSQSRVTGMNRTINPNGVQFESEDVKGFKYNPLNGQFTYPGTTIMNQDAAFKLYERLLNNQ